MVDPTTILATVGGAWLTKELVHKLLGPTADYLGDEIRDLVKHRVEQAKNIGRIFGVAQRRLGDKLNEPGKISPRILKRVWDEGRFTNDRLAAEYFGGLLASSRSEDGDERALPFLQLVEGLSCYALRMHYLFYTVLRQGVVGKAGIDLSDPMGRVVARTYIPVSVIRPLMRLRADQPIAPIIEHCNYSLVASDLVDENVVLGSKDFLIQHIGRRDIEDGLIYRPSAWGLSLFFWVNGYPDAGLNDLLRPRLNFEPIPEIEIPDGAFVVGQTKSDDALEDS